MFNDRADAGHKLAEALRAHAGKRAVVLALPRGGVPVGYEIAKVLKAPLDTIVARKVGAPANPEYAVGAIAPGGVRIIDAWAGNVEAVVREETKEMERRIEKYKSGSYVRGVEPEIVIIVDDGVATGKTALAAVRSARIMYPEAKVVFAAPVGAPDSLKALEREADEVVVLEVPEEFDAVGKWYKHFPQIEDEEVIRFLELSARSPGKVI